MVTKEEVDNLYEKCVKIYEEKGQHAVIEYCKSISWKHWGICDPCEFLSPINPHDKSCLVCGSSN